MLAFKNFKKYTKLKYVSYYTITKANINHKFELTKLYETFNRDLNNVMKHLLFCIIYLIITLV